MSVSNASIASVINSSGSGRFVWVVKLLVSYPLESSKRRNTSATTRARRRERRSTRLAREARHRQRSLDHHVRHRRGSAGGIVSAVRPRERAVGEPVVAGAGRVLADE